MTFLRSLYPILFSIIYTYSTNNLNQEVEVCPITDADIYKNLQNYSVLSDNTVDFIYWYLDKNIKIFVIDNVIMTHISYEEFYMLDKDKKTIVQGLEKSISIKYDEAIYKYAYMVLLIDQKRYKKFNIHLKALSKKIYKNRNNLSNDIILLFKNTKFKDGKNMKNEPIFGKLLIKKINCMYRSFIDYDIHTKFIITSLSTLIFDEIDDFFENGKTFDLKRLTSSIGYYINDVLNYCDTKYAITQKNELKDYVFMIDKYFKQKLDFHRKSQGNYTSFRIPINILDEKEKFELGIKQMYEINKDNRLLNDLLCAFAAPKKSVCDLPFYETEIRYNVIEQFLLLCKTNKNTEDISKYITCQNIEILYIREFYAIFGIDGLALNNKIGYLGLSLAMPTIYNYWSEDVITINHTLRYICKQFKNLQFEPSSKGYFEFIVGHIKNILGLKINSEILNILDGYYKLIADHLMFNQINKVYHNYYQNNAIFSLIEESIAQIYSVKELKYIKEYKYISKHSEELFEDIILPKICYKQYQITKQVGSSVEKTLDITNAHLIIDQDVRENENNIRNISQIGRNDTKSIEYVTNEEAENLKQDALSIEARNTIQIDQKTEIHTIKPLINAEIEYIRQNAQTYQSFKNKSVRRENKTSINIESGNTRNIDVINQSNIYHEENMLIHDNARLTQQSHSSNVTQIGQFRHNYMLDQRRNQYIYSNPTFNRDLRVQSRHRNQDEEINRSVYIDLMHEEGQGCRLLQTHNRIRKRR